MKNFLKFPILFTVLAACGCRSHKTVEVSNYSSNDTCVVQTDLSVHSLTNIEKTESIFSCHAQDLMEFSDEAGEIRIHRNGEMSVKGLKSAHLIRHDIHKQSETTAASNDSLTAKSHTKSSMATSTATKANSTIPATFSIWLKILLFIRLIILLIISTRHVLKRFFN